MKTKNIKNNPHVEWLFGLNSNAIENQEEEGQKELVASLQLPKKCNYPRGLNVIEQYHKMGIKTFTSSKGDDLFIGVKLPDGWKKEATDHSMWNNLKDNKGRVRATIFYRDSFINFVPRYYWDLKYYDDEKINGLQTKTAIVKDNATGNILFESKKHNYEYDEEFNQQAENYLKINFPDYKDINAYWD